MLHSDLVIGFLWQTAAAVIFATAGLAGAGLQALAEDGQSRRGQQPQSGEDQSAAERERAERLEFMKQAAGTYDIQLANEERSKLRLASEPLLRYSDGATGAPDAALFAWTHQGRPEVVGSIYLNARGLWFSELQSLALRGLTAQRDGATIWNPSTGGIELRAVPGAPRPASSAPQRLVQMRALAREFTASVADRISGRVELRLMPQPLFRFADSTEQLPDGALFAFSKGTNPEVLLLLETRLGADGPEWCYALGRMSVRECEARHRNLVVWTVDRAARATMRESSYIELSIARDAQ